MEVTENEIPGVSPASIQLPVKPPLPPPPPPPKKKMYILTFHGGLKLAIVVIGFILVNIGANGVFTSKDYLSFLHKRVRSTRIPEQQLWTSTNYTAACKQMAKDLAKAKRDWRKIKLAAPKIIARATLEANSEAYRLTCNNLVPGWVAIEYYFVFSAITCVVAELVSLMVGVMREDMAKKFRVWDGALHGFLGVFILVGSICLLVGMTERMDEGPDEVIYAARDMAFVARSIYNVRNARREKKNKQSDSSEDDRKRREVDRKRDAIDRDMQLAKANIAERSSKSKVSFNEKVTAASLGFVNCVLYFFAALMIGRRIESFK